MLSAEHRQLSAPGAREQTQHPRCLQGGTGAREEERGRRGGGFPGRGPKGDLEGLGDGRAARRSGTSGRHTWVTAACAGAGSWAQMW